MERWKQEARISCARTRDRKLVELSKSIELTDKLNKEISTLELQIDCKHDYMTATISGGCIGGLDEETCNDCGYEYWY
jgi:hypothetical protein